MTIHSADNDGRRSRLSIVGTTAVFVGLALVAIELRSGTLLVRSGRLAHGLLLLAAVTLSVWGLKEIITGWWPGALPRKVRARRNRFMLPTEGIVYGVIMIVLCAGSAVGSSNTLLLVFALMTGPFIMNGWITFAMLKKLTVRRTVPPRMMAGEPFSVDLELINPKWWLSAWLMSVRDKVGNGREELNPEVLFTRIPRRGQETGRYQLRLSQRGRYSFGPIQINSRFPLGLVERGVILADTAEVLVYPRIGRFTASWRRQLQTATQLVSEAQPRGGSFDDEFHRIREYRPGDNPRAIHWRTTARRNELMVREFRESRDQNLILLLDLFLPERPTEAQRQRLEFAISVAATIYNDQMLNSRDTTVYFAANGAPAQEWDGSSHRGGRDDLLDLLAMLQPDSNADMQDLFEVAHREQASHRRAVLVTTTRTRAEQWDVARASHRGNGDGFLATESPQLIVADPDEMADIYSFT